MSNQIDDGGPAFPQHGWSNNLEVLERMKGQGGLSVRDWFAGQALAGMASKNCYKTIGDLVDAAFDVADAMIAKRRAKE